MKFVLLLTVLIFVSCDSDSLTSSSGTPTQAGCMYPISVWLGVVPPDFFVQVHGVCETALWRRMNLDGAWNDQYFTSASFCVDTATSGAVEYISVNTIQLHGDSGTYVATEPFPLWGYHIWSFGGGNMPTLFDSVQSTKEFAITSPRYLKDTVRREAGFNIKYDLTGTDEAEVYFLYDPDLNRQYDPTVSDSMLTISDRTTIKANGTTSITPTMFKASMFIPQQFPEKGIVTMTIIAYHKKKVIVEGKSYILYTGERCQTSFFYRK